MADSVDFQLEGIDSLVGKLESISYDMKRKGDPTRNEAGRLALEACVMAETFGFDVQVGASGDVAQRTWSNDFGDGYSQSGGLGINNKSQAWDVSVTGKFGAGQKLQLVRDFLDRQEGYKSFLWTPPGGAQGRYRANGYKLSTLGGGLHTLSINFKQVFNP